MEPEGEWTMRRRAWLAGGLGLAVLPRRALSWGAVPGAPEAPAAIPVTGHTRRYPPEMSPIAFVGGAKGTWYVERQTRVCGEGLPEVQALEVGAGDLDATGSWVLRAVAGHAHYVERHEKAPLDAASPPLGRAEATCAALIPIRKSAQWWSLTQDERRTIFEARSRHIADSMPYLPRIARRLYHGRDLGEPFDFLTWFEFAPEHAQAFDELLALLRSREEWRFVEREVEIRLTR